MSLLTLRNNYVLPKVFLLSSQTTNIIQQSRSARHPEAIFIEKTLEEPVLVISEHDNVDIIGPPDPISNIRPIIRKQLLCETALQQKLRLLQDETQIWNQKFWTEHNTKFIQERKKYLEKNLKPGNTTLTADEMSEFYKSFLDKNWNIHVNYNYEWYKRNIRLLFFAFTVSLQNFIKSL